MSVVRLTRDQLQAIMSGEDLDFEEILTDTKGNPIAKNSKDYWTPAFVWCDRCKSYTDQKHFNSSIVCLECKRRKPAHSSKDTDDLAGINHTAQFSDRWPTAEECGHNTGK